MHDAAPTRTLKVPRGSFHATREAGTNEAQCGACSRWTTNYLVMDLGPANDPTDITARLALFLCNADAYAYQDWLNAELQKGSYVGGGALEYYPYLIRWLKEVKRRTL